MASLAGLFVAMGHSVTGSDHAFHPPMGPALEQWGVKTLLGYDSQHLEPTPDMVVVGNVCTRDNPEAKAAIEAGLHVVSMPEAIETLLLSGRPSYVIAGTHGKTTTSSLVAHFLRSAHKDPGFLIGGIPLNFQSSFNLGDLTGPFVIEGDEYDSAFFEKTPKFWRYRPQAALLTAIEQDHIDIYPTMNAYRHAFEEFVKCIPDNGVLVANAGDAEVRRVVSLARCPVVYYGIQHQDWGDVDPLWQASPVSPHNGLVVFDLFAAGSSCGRIASPLLGEHNLLNTVGAMALCAHAANVTIPVLTASLASFQGVKRRQEVLGIANGVYVYDDFAHHPSAVMHTLAAVRARHPASKVIAVFEPRSATACRNLHQAVYPAAFRAADHTLIAPVGRGDIPQSDRLDVAQLAKDIGPSASLAEDNAQIVRTVCDLARPGDAVVIMSNGTFAGLHDKLLVALTRQHQTR